MARICRCPAIVGEMTAADSDMRDDFDVRFEWGAAGTVALALQARVMVVVDVLRFTTAVEAAVSRGAIVYQIGRAHV